MSASSTERISEIKVLLDKPNCDEAKRIMEMVAKAVSPVLKQRNWRVGILTEFFPKDQGLLGLNVNRGHTIKIRLRHHHSEGSFLAYHDILGTMVHEMAHIKISKHDETFYKLMDQLYDEVELAETNPFSGSSTILGGKHSTRDAAFLAGASAQARQRNGTLSAGSGQKLGGRSLPSANLSVIARRELALAAVERRLRDSWCHNDSINDDEEQLREVHRQSESEIALSPSVKISRKPDNAGKRCFEIVNSNSSTVPAAFGSKRIRSTETTASRVFCVCCMGLEDESTCSKRIEMLALPKTEVNSIQNKAKSISFVDLTDEPPSIDDRNQITEKSTWICGACTFENVTSSANVQICEICLAIKTHIS